MRTPASEIPERTQDWNAHQLVAKYGQVIRRSPGGWSTWTGKVWERDQLGMVQHLAEQTVLGFPDEAWRKRSLSAASIEAMVRLAGYIPEVQMKDDPWDAKSERRG